uniref:Uncharacterized protein n=1 Tax=Strix occidentalis caurina TaxID=311401 RepID=A0A8D0F6J3_STROC
MSLADTYLDLARMLLAHADDVVVDLQRDGFGEGHSFAAPVVVLHLDGEGDQFGVLGAEGRELVDAGPLEVVSQPVEGGVVRITGPDAGEVLLRLAVGDAVDRDAFLMGFAPSLLANHLAPCLASAPALAAPVLPKLLPNLVGATVVDTTAGLHWDTGGVVEDEALVALAARRAGLAAGGGGSGLSAGGGARCPTSLEVAVFGAFLSCGNDI